MILENGKNAIKMVKEKGEWTPNPITERDIGERGRRCSPSPVVSNYMSWKLDKQSREIVEREHTVRQFTKKQFKNKMDLEFHKKRSLTDRKIYDR